MSLLTGLPSAICCFFTGINIPIMIDICKSFMIYFQIFTTFRYKSLKNSDSVVRGAFSEAFGVKNRLLRYGRDIRYRKRPPTVRGCIFRAPYLPDLG